MVRKYEETKNQKGKGNGGRMREFKREESWRNCLIQ